MPKFVKIPRQMKEFSIQVLDSDCSVYMKAICYSDLIYTISSEIGLLPLTIIHAKFREGISSIEKVFHASTLLRSFS